MRRYVFFVVGVVFFVSVAWVLWPKMCSTNGWLAYECTCFGYETPMIFEFDADPLTRHGDKQSYCFGYVSDLGHLQ